jgi:hypothetical protein
MVGAGMTLLVATAGCTSVLGEFSVGGSGLDAAPAEGGAPGMDGAPPDATTPAEAGADASLDSTATGANNDATADAADDATADATGDATEDTSTADAAEDTSTAADAPLDTAGDAPADSPTSTGGPSGSLSFATTLGVGYSKVALPQIGVNVADTHGAAVNGVTVSLALNAVSSGAGVLEGTATAASNAMGLAAFAGLDVSKSGTAYTLTASATGYGTATSSPFEIDAWQPWNGTLAGGEVDGMVVSPTNANVAFAAARGGIWRTTDGAASWKRIAFPGAAIGGMAVATDGTTVYAGVGQTGMYKSVDTGATWSAANTGYTTKGVGAVAVVPGDPNTVYWATNGGVLKSTNGGTSWTQVFAGGDAGANAYVDGLAIAPSNANVVYASVFGASVYKSIDAGMSWTNMGGFGTVTSPTVTPLVVDPASSDTVYAGLQNGQGVWKSTGGAFTQLGTAGNPVYQCGTTSMAYDPTTTTLYANCYEYGVFKSVNGGGTWTEAGVVSSARGQNNYALAIAPSMPSTLYLGFWPGNGGIAKSVDSGATWNDASGGFADYQVHGLLVTKSGSILVGGGSLGAGLMRSTDNGNTYAPAGGPNYDGDLSVAGSPFSDTTVYAGADRYALFTSTNTAMSFTTNTTASGAAQIAASPANASTIYSVGFSGCFATTNGGSTWNSVANPTTYPYAYGTSVAAHPTVAATALAGLGDGVYQTVNAGVSWQKVNQPSVYQGWVAYDAAGTGYAAGYVVASSPDGTTWTDITGSLPISSSNPAWLLQAHTISGTNVLYVGVGSRGLWRRINGAWSQSGMEGLEVSALAIDPNTPTTQYAGTLGYGLFRTISGGD